MALNKLKDIISARKQQNVSFLLLKISKEFITHRETYHVHIRQKTNPLYIDFQVLNIIHIIKPLITLINYIYLMGIHGRHKIVQNPKRDKIRQKQPKITFKSQLHDPYKGKKTRYCNVSVAGGPEREKKERILINHSKYPIFSQNSEEVQGFKL